MANYTTLKASVNAYIKANGVRAITGPVLNGILTQMINTLGDGARYGGIATPSGNPGIHDNVVFFLATTAGTYTNYGGAVLDGSTLHILYYDSTWHDLDTGVPTSTAFATKADKAEVVKHTSQSLTESQKTQARTNIGAASEEYVEENVLPLEHEMEPVSDELTKESYDAEHTLDGYLYTGGGRYVYDEYYYTCYFIADKAGQFYVKNKGLGYFNLVIGQGTLENFQNATKWANEDTMPSAESPATVNVGDLVALSFIKQVGGDQNDFQVVFSYEVEHKYIPNENIKEYNEVLDFVHSGGLPLITIKKISNDEIHLYVPTKDGKNYLIHPIIHGTYSHDMTQYGGASDVLCGDNFDPGIITDKDGNAVLQGNLNFIFLIDSNVQGFENEDYHVGTVIDHGLEVREYTKLFADGIEFTIADMTEDIVCSTFRMIQKSKCYAANSSIITGNSQNYPKLNNGEPVVAAIHFVDAKYEVGNIITWRNALEVKRNGTVFSQLHGGMVRSFTNKLHEVVVNDEKFSMNHFAYENGQYVVEPIGDSSNLLYANRHADQADMYGDAIRIFQRMAQDDGARYDKSIMFCQKYEQQDLLSFKVYFMPALVTLRSSIQDAEVFNDGDIISVTNRREIDI